MLPTAEMSNDLAGTSALLFAANKPALETAICSTFLRQGHCTLGQNCRYVHVNDGPVNEGSTSPHPVKKKPASAGAGKANGSWRVERKESSSKAPEGKNRPNVSKAKRPPDGQLPSSESRTLKTTQCKFWARNKNCRNGDKCSFIHQIPAQIPSPESRPTKPRETRSQQGPSPKPRQEVRKKRQCRYLNSKAGCRDGDNCKFAHDPQPPILPREGKVEDKKEDKTEDKKNGKLSAPPSNGTASKPPRTAVAPKESPKGDITLTKKASPTAEKRAVKSQAARQPKACTFFNKTSGCRKGDACEFSHAVKTSASAPPMKASQGNKTQSNGKSLKPKKSVPAATTQKQRSAPKRGKADAAKKRNTPIASRSALDAKGAVETQETRPPTVIFSPRQLDQLMPGLLGVLMSAGRSSSAPLPPSPNRVVIHLKDLD